MKKVILFLTMLVCVFLAVGAGNTLAAIEDNLGRSGMPEGKGTGYTCEGCIYLFAQCNHYYETGGTWMFVWCVAQWGWECPWDWDWYVWCAGCLEQPSNCTLSGPEPERRERPVEVPEDQEGPVLDRTGRHP